MRLLFITSTRIGDAVLSTGLLSHLIETQPQVKVTVACGPVAAPLFQAVPGLERVIPMAKRKHSLHWWELWRKVAATHWDLVVDLRGSGLSYLLRTRARKVMGRADDSLHRVESLGRFFDLDPPPSPKLWITPAQKDRAIKLIPHKDDGGCASPVLAVGPTANWGGKQWRPIFFAELIRRVTAEEGPMPGARVAVLAAPHEREQATPALEAVPAERRIDLIDAVDPLEAYACLKRCALFVGNDSGLMHLAAASGIPTLGLFGPSRDDHYRPWGPQGHVLRTQKSFEELTTGPDYDYRSQATLMDSLTVSMVEREVRVIWTEHRNSPQGGGRRPAGGNGRTGGSGRAGGSGGAGTGGGAGGSGRSGGTTPEKRSARAQEPSLVNGESAV